MSRARYIELQCTSHFSFLRGASSCEELFAQAATLGIEALAIVDRNSLAGIVRAHEAARITGVRLIVGCRLDLSDGPSVLVYPTDRTAYGRLCRLLSLGKRRAGKAQCRLDWSDLVAFGEGLIAVLVPDSPPYPPPQAGEDNSIYPPPLAGEGREGARALGARSDEMEPVRCSPTLRCHSRESGNPVSPSIAGVTGSPAFARVRNSGPYPEEPRAARRLEGWQRVLAVHPSFETRPSGAPQDEGGDYLTPAFAGDDTDVCFDLSKIRSHLRRLHESFGDRAYMALTLHRRPNDALRLHELSNLAAQAGVPTVVTNDVLFHVPGRRILQDVITCIRHNVTIDELGFRRERHADRYLKSPGEMARLFGRYPEALARTLEIAERCRFSLDELAYQYPEEAMIPGMTPQQALEMLTWEGAAKCYPEGVPDKVAASLRHELQLIEKLQYAPYFLTVNSIVRFARSKEILCQGRGSAANSAVCYVLGITSIDPERNDLLFERFVSQERREPPDIDVDFEHERREDVIQDIYARYGTHRAALTATVICYRPRSAMREVGKVFGLTEDVTAALASGVWGSWGAELRESEVRQGRLDPNNPLIARAVAAANELIGFPRHLSQHVGGFVLTRDRLDEIVPVGPATMENRWFIEWDKDDIDSLRMMKVDVLGLGMLSCIRKAFGLIASHEYKNYSLATIPREDPAVYEMLCKADAIGVFQVESRAQMNMLPRLKPKCYYDLVVEVAIVRPGPIQGGMVHPYLKRRQGIEPITYPSDDLKAVLERTMGVPLFQEQAMEI